MKVLIQFFWIMFFSLLGEIASAIIAPIFPIPGSVLGIVLLFIALHWNLLDMKYVKETGSYLAANMGIMFVPAGVGVIAYFDVLRDTWWQLLLITIISTVFYIVFAGKLVQWVNQRQSGNGKAHRKEGEADV